MAVLYDRSLRFFDVEILFLVLLAIFLISGLGLLVLQSKAQEIDIKISKIHQAVIDAVVSEGSRLQPSDYDFKDTVASKVPGQQGGLKRLECTSLHWSSAKGVAVVIAGSIGGDVSLDETIVDPLVEVIHLEMGDILDVEISVNEERTSNSSGKIGGRTGQTLLGSVLFGVAGGQIAASGRRDISLTSKEEVLITTLALEIFTRNADHPYLFIHFFPNMKSTVDSLSSGSVADALSSSLIVDRNEYKQLKKWYSAFLSLKENPVVSRSYQPGSDIADQLSKLYGLQERGIITLEEFEEAKKKILDS